jgi:hypothetical protein
MNLGRAIILCAIGVTLSPLLAVSQVTIPLPAGARDVEHAALQPRVNEQVAFWVDEQFPAVSVVEHYGKIFAGWMPCNQEGGATWQSFSEASGGQTVAVHRLARYWASPNNSTAISLFLRYESQRELAGGKPDNPRQAAVLLQLRTPDARKHLSRIGANCDKRT